MQIQKHFKDFISNRPELLRAYVNTSVTTLNYLLVPINIFMEHLLKVQDLDPNSEPGEKDRLALLEALSDIDKLHNRDYDDDYDLSWVKKKFDKVREKFNLTQETFVGLTDLSHLPDREENVNPLTIDSTEVNQIAPESEKREIRVFGDMEQERDNLKTVLRELVQKADKAIKENTAFDPGDAFKRLTDAAESAKSLSKYPHVVDAIQQLADVAEKAGIGTKKTNKKTKSDKKSGIKTSKKKLNKGSKGTRINRRSPTAAEKQQYTAKKSAIKESIKAKFHRSQKLVDKMVAKGLLTNTKEAIQEQLQQVLLLNDDAIESLDRVVERHGTPSTDPNFKGLFRRID